MAATVLFKDYDEATRREFAKKGWALPDGSFPIATKADLSDALHRIGSTNHKRADVLALIRKRAKALDAMDMLGDKTAPKAKSAAPTQTSAVAQFSSTRKMAPDGSVIRRGKVFEPGTRLDMHGIPFTVTEPEIANMIVNFKPFPVGSGHPEAPSPLDGHLGQVTNFFLGKNHKDLWAEVHLPPFVDSVIGDGDVGVSMVFDRMTKEPLGLDFVSDPNVVDAALTASFASARHDTYSGQRSIQKIHDASVRGGAICRKKSKHASPHEAQAMQKIHDISTAHGAHCDNGRMFARAPGNRGDRGDGMNWKKFWDGLFASAESHESGTSSFANGNGGEGGDGGDPNDYESDWQEQQMSGAEPPDGDDDEDDGGDEGEGDMSMTRMARNTGAVADTVKMALDTAQARNVQLEQELARERAHRIENEAVSFAETEINEHRSLPAEREFLIELYRQAAADDATLGAVKMAGGTVTSRTERLKAMFSSRGEHWMTKEMLSTALEPSVVQAAMKTAQAAFSSGGKPMDEAAKQKYLNMTPLGASVLASKNGNGNSASH